MHIPKLSQEEKKKKKNFRVAIKLFSMILTNIKVMGMV